MSERGWAVVHAIDAGEREIEERRARDRWRRFADRLAPEERRRIAHGSYKAIVRPIKPEWGAGDWLDVSAGLSVHVKEITFRRQSFRTIIDQVRDFRTNRLPMRRFREDPENMVTIVPVNVRPPNPPEPDGLSKAEQEEITKHAGEAEIMRLRQTYTQQRAKIDEAIAELREAGITDRELWIMERRMDKLGVNLGARDAA